MASSPAPWLAGLDDDWVAPQTTTAPAYDADNKSANSPSTMRKGLSQLSQANSNSRNGSIRARPCEGPNTSKSSAFPNQFDTVERKVSPKRSEAEMEWKKRLVDGDLDYGDQTDLFGPSGLENIFQSPSKPTSPVTKSRVAMLKTTQFMPSSPPPWPSSRFEQQSEEESLLAVDEHMKHQEEQDDSPDMSEVDQNSPHVHQSSLNRQVSGQSEVGNLSFSPVFISKHTTLSGEIGYTAMDSETARLIQKSSLLASRQLEEEANEMPQAEMTPSRPFLNLMDDSIPQVEISLPDNLPTGTPPLTKLSEFVSVKRGGNSNYGSFKTRPLSPSDPESRPRSMLMDTVDERDFACQVPLHEKIENVNDPAATSPSLVKTPEKKQKIQDLQLPTPRSAVSPLKLFGIHDTFTNSKLLRRLSQLEDKDDQALFQAARRHVRNKSSASRPAVSVLEDFGHADLDEQDFEANLSFPSVGYQRSDSDGREGSPEPDVQPPGARSPEMFAVDRGKDTLNTYGVKRKLSDRSTNKSNKSIQPSNYDFGTVRSRKDLDFVQRSPVSPIKAPTPKRQRTLHQLDLLMDEKLLKAQESQSVAQNNVRRPSSPAFSEAQDMSPLPAHIHARPSNPTPSQQRSILMEESLDNLESSPRLQAIRDRIEESSLPGSVKLVSQAKAVANQVAAFTLNVTKDNGDAGNRQRSITTQDFLNEAMQIMSLIRARGRPQSGLGSVEETSEDMRPMDAPVIAQSDGGNSVLRLSRPPSRDGTNSGWRPRSQPHQDPEVVSQLRKFEEDEDMAILDATLHSLKLKGVSRATDHDGDDEESSIIRITGPDDASDAEVTDLPAVDSLRTDYSAEYSVGRTQGTSSSRKSDNVATLAPESVAHLIPEQVAGMTFDRVQGKWVRIRHEQIAKQQTSTHPASNITSDDDPFGNIPDLTVDELREMQQVRSSQASHRTAFLHGSQRNAGHVRHSSQDETDFTRPSTGNDGLHAAMRSSVAPARSNLASSQIHVETRATSYATEPQSRPAKPTQAATGHHIDTSARFLPARPTMSDSYQAQPASDDVSSVVDSELEEAGSDIEELPVIPPPSKHDRHVSFHQETFGKWKSGQEIEQNEISIIAEMPDRRIMSVSVSVSRPPPLTAEPVHQLQHWDDRMDSSELVLSDLPEFTMANVEDLPGPTERYLSASVAQHGLETANDRYALAVQDMVKALTDAKGDDPFWEEIKHLSLQNQKMEALHGLNDFCVQLQKLDVSHNRLSQLRGAPQSLRWLAASNNLLSGLTSWHHLHNLQYLDVSHNGIDDLDGLGSLQHLRELKACHNKITSVAGLAELEGLIKLDLSHNELASADVSRCQWNQLEWLDMSANGMTSLSSADRLTTLKTLILNDNKLARLTLAANPDNTSRLCEVSASGNQLQSLDITHLPELRYLDLDNNSVKSLTGLTEATHLDVLSLRSQKSDDDSGSIWQTIFAVPVHARCVYISANRLPEHVECFAVQNTISSLELASCGLLSLPNDFGLHFPNLRNLNLNFNALKDLRPVLNLSNLKTLSAAGNRLSRLRKCVEALSLLPELSNLDLRDNPLTLGFYSAKSADLHHEDVSCTLTRTAMRPPAQLQHHASWTRVQERKQSRFLGPEATEPLDDVHRKLMDQDSMLKRRVYEILLVSSCRKLVTLDALKVDRTRVLEKDQAWSRLRELGVLKVKKAL